MKSKMKAAAGVMASGSTPEHSERAWHADPLEQGEFDKLSPQDELGEIEGWSNCMPMSGREHLF